MLKDESIPVLPVATRWRWSRMKEEVSWDQGFMFYSAEQNTLELIQLLWSGPGTNRKLFSLHWTEQNSRPVSRFSSICCAAGRLSVISRFIVRWDENWELPPRAETLQLNEFSLFSQKPRRLLVMLESEGLWEELSSWGVCLHWAAQSHRNSDFRLFAWIWGVQWNHIGAQTSSVHRFCNHNIRRGNSAVSRHE